MRQEKESRESGRREEGRNWCGSTVAHLEDLGSFFQREGVCLFGLAVLSCCPGCSLLAGEGRLVERREF